MSDELTVWLQGCLDDVERVAEAAYHDPAEPMSGEWITYDHSPGARDRLPDHPVTLVGAESDDHAWMVCEVGQFDRAPLIGAHIALHDPARVLAQVAAMRRIIAEHAPDEDGRCTRCTEPEDMQVWYDSEADEETVTYERRSMLHPCTTLRLLALPFADRPGYKPEWSPDA